MDQAHQVNWDEVPDALEDDDSQIAPSEMVGPIVWGVCISRSGVFGSSLIRMALSQFTPRPIDRALP